MQDQQTTTCPSCGSPQTGTFCGQCGRRLTAGTCRACRAHLSAQARYCHRCGAPVGLDARRGRAAWIVAAVVTGVLLGAVAWGASGGWQPAPPPDMANVGSQSGGLSTRASDISQMSPRERFDRLYRRIMNAGAQGDSTAVVNFTPMALASYAQLGAVDITARYQAALLRLQIGDLEGTLALADTMEQQVPGHLFVPVLRGTVARFTNDTTSIRQSFETFLAHYDRERATQRPEYASEELMLAEFREAALGGSP